jgi:hypothetical protein
MQNTSMEIPAAYAVRRLPSMDKFGSFRVSVSSEGAESPEALTHRSVKGAKLIFTPGMELKNSLKSLSFTVTS